jgi:hypothetical protein
MSYSQAQLHEFHTRACDLVDAFRKIAAAQELFDTKIMNIIAKVQKYRLARYRDKVWHEGLLFYATNLYLAKKFHEYQGQVKDSTTTKPNQIAIEKLLGKMYTFIKTITPARVCYPLLDCLYPKTRTVAESLDLTTCDGVLTLLDIMVSADFYQYVLQNDAITWILWANVIAVLQEIVIPKLSDWASHRSVIAQEYLDIGAAWLIEKMNRNCASLAISEVRIINFGETLENFITASRIFIRREHAVNAVSIDDGTNAHSDTFKAYFRHLLQSLAPHVQKLGKKDLDGLTFFSDTIVPFLLRPRKPRTSAIQKTMTAEFIYLVEAIEIQSRIFFAPTPSGLPIRRPTSASNPSVPTTYTVIVSGPKLIGWLTDNFETVMEKINKLARNQTTLLPELRKNILNPSLLREVLIPPEQQTPEYIAKCNFFLSWNIALLELSPTLPGTSDFIRAAITQFTDYARYKAFFQQIITAYTTTVREATFSAHRLALLTMEGSPLPPRTLSVLGSTLPPQSVQIVHEYAEISDAAAPSSVYSDPRAVSSVYSLPTAAVTARSDSPLYGDQPPPPLYSVPSPRAAAAAAAAAAPQLSSEYVNQAPPAVYGVPRPRTGAAAPPSVYSVPRPHAADAADVTEQPAEYVNCGVELPKLSDLDVTNMYGPRGPQTYVNFTPEHRPYGNLHDTDDDDA